MTRTIIKTAAIILMTTALSGPALAAEPASTPPNVSVNVDIQHQTATPEEGGSVVTMITKETPQISSDARILNLADFDLNKDKILTRNEIGEKMFDIYDVDGNMVIDNIEYAAEPVLTVVPFEKETTHTYDYNGDGLIDEQTITQETFIERTMLTKFDKNRNGLSAEEFTERKFYEADVDGDHFITRDEWKGSYIASLDARNKSKATYNQ